ncbi:hypothetical protein [Rickettsia endosymbiont of Orchestes rusci]
MSFPRGIGFVAWLKFSMSFLAQGGALLHGYQNRHCEEAFMPTWQSS